MSSVRALEQFAASYVEVTFGHPLTQFKSTDANIQLRLIRDFGGAVYANVVSIRVAWDHLEEMRRRLDAFVLDAENHSLVLNPDGVAVFRDWATNQLDGLDPAIVADPLGRFPGKEYTDLA